MPLWRRYTLAFIGMGCLAAASLQAAPVDETRQAPAVSAPAFRSAINVMTTSQGNPSFFASPPSLPAKFKHETRPALSAPNLAASSSSLPDRNADAISSEVSGPSSTLEPSVMRSVTRSASSAAPATDSTSPPADGGSAAPMAREFSLGQATPEPGSLGLLSLASLLLLRRSRRRA